MPSGSVLATRQGSNITQPAVNQPQGSTANVAQLSQSDLQKLAQYIYNSISSNMGATGTNAFTSSNYTLAKQITPQMLNSSTATTDTFVKTVKALVTALQQNNTTNVQGIKNSIKTTLTGIYQGLKASNPNLTLDDFLNTIATKTAKIISDINTQTTASQPSTQSSSSTTTSVQPATTSTTGSAITTNPYVTLNKKQLLKTQHATVEGINTKSDQFKEATSTYDLLQNILDAVKYAIKYNQKYTPTSGQKKLLLALDVSKADYDKLKEVLGEKDNLFIELKDIIGKNKDATKQSLTQVKNLLSAKLTALIKTEQTLISDLSKLTTSLTKIQSNMVAKGLTKSLENPKGTTPSKVVHDTRTQTDHNNRQEQIDIFNANANNLIAFREAVAILTAAKAAKAANIKQKILDQLTPIQRFILQSNGINISGSTLPANTAIATVAQLFESNIQASLSALKNLPGSTQASQKKLWTQLQTNIISHKNTAKNTYADKLSDRDRMSKILAVVESVQEENDTETRNNLPNSRKLTPLTDEQKKFIRAQADSQGSQIIKNLEDPSDSVAFAKGLQQLNDLQAKLSGDLIQNHVVTTQLDQSLTKIQSYLTANNLTSLIQTSAASKLNPTTDIAAQTAVQTQVKNYLQDFNKRRKLKAFLGTLNALVQGGKLPQSFNLSYLDTETLNLLKEEGIISGNNVFSGDLSKTDYQVINENEQGKYTDTDSVAHYNAHLTQAAAQQIVNAIKAKLSSTVAAVLPGNLVSTVKPILQALSQLIHKKLDKASDNLTSTLKVEGELEYTKATKIPNQADLVNYAKQLKKDLPVKPSFDSATAQWIDDNFSKNKQKITQPTKKAEITSAESTVESYKYTWMAQKNRLLNELSQVTQLTQVMHVSSAKKAAQATQATPVTQTTTVATKLQYTEVDYNSDKQDYTKYAHQRHKREVETRLSAFIEYLQTVVDSLVKNKFQKKVKIEPNLITPEILKLITKSTQGSFMFAPPASPASTEVPTGGWTDFYTYALGLLKNTIGIGSIKSVPLGRTQLTALITELKASRDKIHKEILDKIHDIKSDDIAENSYRETEDQAIESINNLKNERHETVDTIRKLQSIIWRVSEIIDDEIKDSQSTYSVANFLNAQNIHTNKPILTEEDRVFLSKFIDKNVLKKINEPTAVLGDLQAFKERLESIWDEKMNNQQSMKTEVDVHATYLTDSNKAIDVRGNMSAIKQLYAKSNIYTSTEQDADEKSYDPYLSIKRDISNISELKSFLAMLTKMVEGKQPTDSVQFNPSSLKAEIFKALEFSRAGKFNSLFNIPPLNNHSFFQEPVQMSDGTPADLGLHGIYDTGMLRDFKLLLYNSKVAKNNTFSLIGASWSASDVQSLIKLVTDKITNLSQNYDDSMQVLSKYSSSLKSTEIHTRVVKLEYSYYVKALNSNITDLNNYSAIISALKEAIFKTNNLSDYVNDYMKSKNKVTTTTTTPAATDFVMPKVTKDDGTAGKLVDISLPLATEVLKRLKLAKTELAAQNINANDLPQTPQELIRLLTGSHIPNQGEKIQHFINAVTLALSFTNRKNQKLSIIHDNLVSKISSLATTLNKLKAPGLRGGVLAETSGRELLGILKRQRNIASDDREDLNAKIKDYNRYQELLTKAHTAIDKMIRSYFTEKDPAKVDTVFRAIPVKEIMAIGDPRIITLLKDYQLFKSHEYADAAIFKIFGDDQRVFKVPTKFADGSPITAQWKQNHPNWDDDYNLMAYNLANPNNKLDLQGAEYKRSDMQEISNSFNIRGKQLANQTQVKISELQETEMTVTNLIQQTFDFNKTFLEICNKILERF